LTPAIKAADRAGISYTLHDYQHDPEAESWGMEASEKLNVEPLRVFKTLVVKLDTKELIVGIVAVTGKLGLKAIAHAAGGKKAAMADPRDVQRSTGYVLGGVSPLGQKKQLRTFIDDSARDFDTVFVSAGRRGLEIELAPADLATLTTGCLTALHQQ